MRDLLLSQLKEYQEKFDTMDAELELCVKDPALGVEGFVVVWNTAICQGGVFAQNGRLGCGKGGTRVMQGTSLEGVKRLAKNMALKNAAAGLPLGGAKSGVNIDPNDPSYETKYRRFVKLVQEEGVLYEDGGIFGGFGYDIGGRPPLNAIWACDELKSTKSFTGKPVDMGGTDYDKQGIAGYGVAVAARTALACKGYDIAQASFAVQGVGAMGAAVLHYFSEFGAKLKAFSDPRYGGLWRFKTYASDKSIQALFTQDEKAVKACLEDEADFISDDNSTALYESVDVVFPCALEDTITLDNVERVIAPFVVEGANNPTRPEAKERLFELDRFLVPDVLANPGGIIAAFVEMTVQEGDKVVAAKKETEERITKNVEHMISLVREHGVRPEQAALYMIYKNIFKQD